MTQRRAAALLVAAVSFGSALPAQEPSGPYLPIGSRLEALTLWAIESGVLARIDPLTRPFRFGAVRNAAENHDDLGLTPSGRQALRWLQDELASAADTVSVNASIGFGAWRNGLREGFRQGGAAGAGPQGGIQVQLSRGPFSLVLNPAFDNRLKDDPEFTGKTDRFIAGRMQSAYIMLAGSIGELAFGRYERQWGPALFPGLQLSPTSYATDALSGALRLGRFELTTLAQRLDDHPPLTGAESIDRWFLAHRLSLRLGSNSWLALTETGVYGGPGRGFEPLLHSPVNLALLSQFNDGQRVNLLWGGEARLWLPGRLLLEAQAVIDDVQIDDSAATDSRPWSGGFTVVLQHAMADLPVHLAMGYTRVRSLTYRNSFATWERYDRSGVGLGRNYSDYDQAVVRVHWRPSATIAARLDLSHIRQGSGDFRQPFPADSVLALPGQGFLVAPVTRALGATVTASALLRRGLRLEVQTGVDGNVAGLTRGIARFQVTASADLLRRQFGAAWPALESFIGP